MLHLVQPLFQSPFLYLQAAGSDGSDGSSPGIHLRWDFRKMLKENHLPKGNLGQEYPSRLPFNRQDDYVNIYRAQWHRYSLTVNFVRPDRVINTGAERRWEYDAHGVGGVLRNVLLRFVDVAQYDQLQSTFPGKYSDIFQGYNGIFELEVEGELFFYTEFLEWGRQNSRSSVEIESISLKDTGNRSDQFVSCRKVFGYPLRSVQLQCEHISVLRFRLRGINVYTARIDTYIDTVLGTESKQSWQKVGKFSLTLDDLEAERRLESPGDYVIDRQWPKFNETNQGTGAFVVNVKNYQNRWYMPEGLKKGVGKYLTLSMSDPTATAVIPSSDGQSNTEFNYLAMLNFAALDYHVARMLGLGHIDAVPYQTQGERPYLYLAEYITESAMGTGFPAGQRTHYSMSLPTLPTDYRYPPVPVLKPITYGLYASNGTQNPTLISDPQGYVPVTSGPFDYVRYVNLHREPFIYQRGMVPFFHNSDLFCSCHQSQAVLFGIDYKKQSEPSYRRPEILKDDTYKDHAGIPVVAPIPEHGENDRAIYVHEEQEEGIHVYSLYSINWFSRTWERSNLVSTDFTRFPKRNSLRPPSNFAVQLIQKENPLIFTSSQEQAQRNALVGDKTLVRVTFDWMDIHNIEYQFANKVELYFRSNKPLLIEGKVTNVNNVIGGLADVQTGPLHITSVTPNYTLSPFVNATDTSRFIGGQISIDGTFYEVVQIITTGNNPRIRVKRNLTTQILDPNGTGEFIATEAYEAIGSNSPFVLYEKTTTPSSWDFKLTKEVQLVQFLPAHQETINHSDGTSTIQHVGGIYRPATVSEVEDVYGPNDPAVTANPTAAPFAGDTIPGSSTGIFKIKFNGGYSLNAHPDAGVEWYRGWVRVMEDAALFPPLGSPNYRAPQMKKLSVAKIVSTNPLELVVVDPEFDPNSTFSNPKTEYMPIDKGGAININYHPGYKLYLEDDVVGTNNFSESTILPGVGDAKKITFMGIRSKDTTQASILYSSMSIPTPLLALEIQEPVAPGVPKGPQYATRPDFYGKSTYTFDMEVDVTGGRKPYALIFYRADHRKILNALYLPATINTIIDNLNNLSDADAAFSNDRWNDLVNVNFDLGTHKFKAYIPGGYHFPLPDNSAYTIPNVNPTIVQKPLNGTRNFADSFVKTLYIDPNGTPVTESVPFADLVKEAIDGAFLPLTEQPVLYKYVKQGYQTSAEKPKIRDAGGNIIYPTSGVPIDFNVFDPFPMTTRFVDGGATKVRFTDYTLDGASTSLFFYFGVELSNRMEVSDSSPAAGPILLVNTMPAEEPTIKKLESRTANSIIGAKSGVRLEVNPYIASEMIDKFQVFRSTEYANTTSTRTMDLVGEFALDEELFDDFSDLSIPPYGEPLFYRVVALRKIKNEHNNDEWVPSKPSKVGLTNIIDTNNPAAPVLSYQSAPSVGAPPLALTNVSIQWHKTTHNGAYHLYKMTAKGNWELIKTTRTNDASINVPLTGTTLNNGSLNKQDSDGNEIFHHFKVTAENASGLLSVQSKVLTV